MLGEISRNIIGKIGEDLPRNEFSNISNLNEFKNNFPIFDIKAERDGEIYVFSAKARKRYGANGKINPCYNILYGKTMSKKYRKALIAFEKMGYDIDKIHYCFLICPLEEKKSCVYYWGEFTDINPLCSKESILENKISYFGVKVADKYLATYKVFGVCEWDYIKKKYFVKI